MSPISSIFSGLAQAALLLELSEGHEWLGQYLINFADLLWARLLLQHLRERAKMGKESLDIVADFRLKLVLLSKNYNIFINVGCEMALGRLELVARK